MLEAGGGGSGTRVKFKERVIENWVKAERVQEWWAANSRIMREAAEEILGKTSGKKAPVDKETWWWNKEVQSSVNRKKAFKKLWDTSAEEGDKRKYQEAKKEAKRAVVAAKKRAWDELYSELETPEGENKLFKIAKSRGKASKNLTQIKQMKGGQGEVLTEVEKITDRWKTYFATLLNKENPRIITRDGVPNYGVTRDVTRVEVERALKKMKNAKGVGPDQIPLETGKVLGN